MKFSFRKSIGLAKGLRLNLSKSGTSLSVGQKGSTVNIKANKKKKFGCMSLILFFVLVIPCISIIVEKLLGN